MKQKNYSFGPNPSTVLARSTIAYSLDAHFKIRVFPFKYLDGAVTMYAVSVMRPQSELINFL